MGTSSKYQKPWIWHYFIFNSKRKVPLLIQKFQEYHPEKTKELPLVARWKMTPLQAEFT
jgi:hypothetical protein